MDHSPFSSDFPIQVLSIGGTLVSYEDSSHHLAHLSSQDKETYLRLLHQAQIQPKQTYKEVLAWQQQISSFAELDNLLAFLHLQNKEIAQAEKLMEASYQKYPDYLFSKINYADQCIRQKKLSRIPQIFPSFDLSELFPHKKTFHVSEFRGFMLLLAHYHLALKNKQTAISYYEKAYAADPTHPGVIFLEKKLFPRILSLANACSYFKKALHSIRSFLRKRSFLHHF